jgi:hypothetical protein
MAASVEKRQDADERLTFGSVDPVRERLRAGDAP